MALALLAVPSFAQKYSVTGQVPKELKKVYLYNFESQNDQKPDSAVVKDGRFSFSGDAQGKLFAMLFANDGGYSVPVILDGNVTADLVKNVIAGTSENEKLSAVYIAVKALHRRVSESVRRSAQVSADEGKETARTLCSSNLKVLMRKPSRA